MEQAAIRFHESELGETVLAQFASLNQIKRELLGGFRKHYKRDPVGGGVIRNERCPHDAKYFIMTLREW